MAVASAVVAAAAVLSAASSIKQGRDAKKQADAQANIAGEQAARERELAGFSEQDFRRRQSAALGEFKAARGASGTVSGTGTDLLASEDFLNEVELQALRIRKGGQVQASRLEQQADLLRSAGRSARTAGYARGGASLLTGFAEFNDRRPRDRYSQTPQTYNT